MTDVKQVSFRLPADVADWLRIKAAVDAVPQVQIVERVLRAEMDAVGALRRDAS